MFICTGPDTPGFSPFNDRGLGFHAKMVPGPRAARGDGKPENWTVHKSRGIWIQRHTTITIFAQKGSQRGSNLDRPRPISTDPGTIFSTITITKKKYWPLYRFFGKNHNLGPFGPQKVTFTQLFLVFVEGVIWRSNMQRYRTVNSGWMKLMDERKDGRERAPWTKNTYVQ